MKNKDPRTILTAYNFEPDKNLLGKLLATPLQRLFAILIDLTIIGILTYFQWYYSLLIFSILMLINFFRKKIRLRMKLGTKIAFAIASILLFLITVMGIVGDFYYQHKILPMTQGKFDSKEDSLKFAQFIALTRKKLSEDSISRIKVQEALHLSEGKQVPASIKNLLKIVIMKNNVETHSITEERINLLNRFTRAYSKKDTQQINQLIPEVREIIAGPVIKQYKQKIDSLFSENITLLKENHKLKEQISNPSFKYLLKSALHDLGFSLGLAGLYFILILFWTDGFTPGKRIVGIRVIRLNGHHVSLWNAFERYGGYAAGLATGLLGFLQIYWDPNRQGIHDKIAATVVIRMN